MIVNLLRRLALVAYLAFGACPPAGAVESTNILLVKNTWTNLGTGLTVLVQGLNGAVVIAVSDSEPSGPIGNVLLPNHDPVLFSTTSTVWAYSSAPSATVTVVPVVDGSSGGSGGGTSSNFAAAFPSAGTAIGVKDSTGTNLTFLTADASNNLNVAVVSTPETAAFAGFGSAMPSDGFAAGFSDGTNLMRGPRVYDADSGAGTEYVLGALLRKSGAGGSVEIGTATDPLRTDPTGTTTQPVSAASLPLPSGAATSANQSTVISSLSAIDGGIPGALGQTTMAASMPVAIASNQTAIPASQSGTWRVGSEGVFYSSAFGSAATYSGSSSNAKAIGGIQTITGMFSTADGSGILTYVSLFLHEGQTNPITIYLFRANPTASTCTNNADFVLSASDYTKLIWDPITITPLDMPGIAESFGIYKPNIAVKNSDASTSLYACVTTASSLTLAAASVRISLGVDQN
jgi:hypothetical protein